MFTYNARNPFCIIIIYIFFIKVLDCFIWIAKICLDTRVLCKFFLQKENENSQKYSQSCYTTEK